MTFFIVCNAKLSICRFSWFKIAQKVPISAKIGQKRSFLGWFLAIKRKKSHKNSKSGTNPGYSGKLPTFTDTLAVRTCQETCSVPQRSYLDFFKINHFIRGDPYQILSFFTIYDMKKSSFSKKCQNFQNFSVKTVP